MSDGITYQCRFPSASRRNRSSYHGGEYGHAAVLPTQLRCLRTEGRGRRKLSARGGVCTASVKGIHGQRGGRRSTAPAGLDKRQPGHLVRRAKDTEALRRLWADERRPDAEADARRAGHQRVDLERRSNAASGTTTISSTLTMTWQQKDRSAACHPPSVRRGRPSPAGLYQRATKTAIDMPSSAVARRVMCSATLVT